MRWLVLVFVGALFLSPLSYAEIPSILETPTQETKPAPVPLPVPLNDELPPPANFPELNRPDTAPVAQQKSTAPAAPGPETGAVQNFVPPPVEVLPPLEVPPVPTPPQVQSSPAVPHAEPSLLAGQADSLFDSYLPLIQSQNMRNRLPGYAPNVGHSVGAAILLMCRPELSGQDQAQLLMAISNQILSQSSPLVDRMWQLNEQRAKQMRAQNQFAAGKAFLPEVSQMAGHLACKMNGRSVGEVVAALFAAHDELQTRLRQKHNQLRLSDEPHALLTTAILLQ